MDRALKNMNRLVKKVLQMYIGIEWNSMDEFDRRVPDIFAGSTHAPCEKKFGGKYTEKPLFCVLGDFPMTICNIPFCNSKIGRFSRDIPLDGFAEN